MNTPHDQCSQSRIITINCRQMRDRVRDRVLLCVTGLHLISIYRDLWGTQRDRRVRSSFRVARALMVALLQLTSTVGLGATPAPSTSCSAALDTANPYLRQRLATLGTHPAQATVAVASGHEWLIEAREQGNDAIAEVQDGAGHVLAQADHPERRTGTRRIIISPSDSPSLTVRVTGKEHEAVTGTVEILIFDLAPLSQNPACVRALHSLAAADADYFIAQQISRGRLTSATQTARDAYLRAAKEYRAAEALLDDPADVALRADAALALAGVWYFDLRSEE